MSKHTPGPWAVGKFNPNEIHSLSAYDEPVIANVRLREGEDLANARLIAAAPELLEAAKAAWSALDAAQAVLGNEGDYQVNLDMLCDAIKKAEGKK